MFEALSGFAKPWPCCGHVLPSSKDFQISAWSVLSLVSRLLRFVWYTAPEESTLTEVSPTLSTLGGSLALVQPTPLLRDTAMFT